MALTFFGTACSTGKDFSHSVDTDNDEKVSLNEFNDNIPHLFDRYDSNSDGTISSAELMANKNVTDGEESFNDMDTNKDGKVDKKEFKQSAMRRFKICDRNCDTYLEKPEIENPRSLPLIRPFLMFSF